MRIEVPDNEIRKKMGVEELMKTVMKASEWWKELLEKKKASNIKFIQEFIEDIDKKRRQCAEKVTSTPILHVPMPQSSFVMEQPTGSSVCISCSKLKSTLLCFLFIMFQKLYSSLLGFYISINKWFMEINILELN